MESRWCSMVLCWPVLTGTESSPRWSTREVRLLLKLLSALGLAAPDVLDFDWQGRLPATRRSPAKLCRRKWLHVDRSFKEMFFSRRLVSLECLVYALIWFLAASFARGRSHDVH